MILPRLAVESVDFWSVAFDLLEEAVLEEVIEEPRLNIMDLEDAFEGSVRLDEDVVACKSNGDRLAKCCVDFASERLASSDCSSIVSS